MTKIKTFIFFLYIIPFIVNAQSNEFNLFGIVIDSDTKNPIEDALIILNNNLIGFTNKDGKFNFKIYASPKDRIVFNHFSYQSKTLVLNNISKSHEIKLSKKTIALDEVVIGENKSEKEDTSKKFYKAIIKKFKSTHREAPYWSSINLKQITSVNDTLPSYLEIDGGLFMLGQDDKDVWNFPILIPSKSRRTREDFINHEGIPVNSEEDTIHNHLGINNLPNLTFLSYRFFEASHPLNSKGLNRYDFTLEDTIELEGDFYYVINFKSKKNINHIKSRKFRSIRGQLLIQKDKIRLKKITALYKRDGINSIFTVNYKEINDIIYPEDIFYDLSFETNKSNLLFKGLLSFKDIDTREIENYRNIITGNRYLFINSEVYNNYDDDYWKNKPMTTPKLASEIYLIFNNKSSNNLFKQGALQKHPTPSKYLEEEMKILRLKEQHDQNK